MPMTEQERAELEKYLQGVDKNAKAYRYTRWLEIVLGSFVLALGIWLLTKVPSVAEAGVPKDLGRPPDALDLMAARDSAFSLCCFLGMGAFNVYIGSTLFVRSLFRWNKGRNDRLLVAMARAFLETQKPCPTEEA